MLSNFKETEPTVQRYSVKKVTDDRRLTGLTERVPADPPRNWLNWKFSRNKYGVLMFLFVDSWRRIPVKSVSFLQR